MSLKKRKAITTSNENDSIKKAKSRIQQKTMNFDKFTKNKTHSYIEKHVKLFMQRNFVEMYFIENRIKSNDFRVANYFNLFNIAHLRLLIEKIHSTLETWTSIRDEFDNFSFYANANLFDWLNEIEKSNDIDVK